MLRDTGQAKVRHVIPSDIDGDKRAATPYREAWQVYVITDGAGHFKIGISTVFPARLASLQSGNSTQLSCVDIYDAPHKTDAAWLEKEILNGCRRHRAVGEWIKTSEKPLLRYIERRFGVALDLFDSVYRRDYGVARTRRFG